MTLKKWLGIELIEVSATEKLVATFGGALSMIALISFSWWALPQPSATAVVASMGASAVLLFAVPHGPLSQPWPVVAGHGISAVIGVTCGPSLARLIRRHQPRRPDPPHDATRPSHPAP